VWRKIFHISSFGNFSIADCCCMLRVVEADPLGRCRRRSIQAAILARTDDTDLPDKGVMAKIELRPRWS
jgi:hypothetical protein